MRRDRIATAIRTFCCSHAWPPQHAPKSGTVRQNLRQCVPGQRSSSHLPSQTRRLNKRFRPKFSRSFLPPSSRRSGFSQSLSLFQPDSPLEQPVWPEAVAISFRRFISCRFSSSFVRIPHSLLRVAEVVHLSHEHLFPASDVCNSLLTLILIGCALSTSSLEAAFFSSLVGTPGGQVRRSAPWCSSHKV